MAVLDLDKRPIFLHVDNEEFINYPTLGRINLIIILLELKNIFMVI